MAVRTCTNSSDFLELESGHYTVVEVKYYSTAGAYIPPPLPPLDDTLLVSTVEPLLLPSGHIQENMSWQFIVKYNK